MPESELEGELGQVADKLLETALEFHQQRTNLLMSNIANNRATLSIAVSLRVIAGLLKQLVSTPEKKSRPCFMRPCCSGR